MKPSASSAASVAEADDIADGAPLPSSPQDDYRAPAVDRAVAILDAIEAFRDGLSLQELADICKVPKSTVYRIVNSLIAANLARRIPSSGTYVLGSRLLGYAANVVSPINRQEVIRVARPHLELLTKHTGASSKLSVLDGDMALCIDVVPGTSNYSVAPTVGRRWPLHSGGAGKLLLAEQSAKFKADFMARGMSIHTASTITDARDLLRELDQVAKQGWAEDRGEHVSSVSALAAPIRDPDGKVVAAVSIAYFSEMHEAYRTAYLSAVQDCGSAVSASLPELGGLVANSTL